MIETPIVYLIFKKVLFIFYEIIIFLIKFCSIIIIFVLTYSQLNKE